jgi:glucokinase
VDDLVFVAIGTGIAAAVVSGGHLLRGHRGATAEIGHLGVRPGIRCACGGDGCLEAVASASAIARRYTALTDRAVDGAGQVAERLAVDVAARTVWTDAVDALADALTAVSLLVSPERVVIGGGLGDAGDLLLAPLRTALEVRARVVSAPAVTAAVHGRRSGVVGAALLAFDDWAVEA